MIFRQGIEALAEQSGLDRPARLLQRYVRQAFGRAGAASRPATFPKRCLATRVRNGQVEVGPGADLGSCAHEPVPSPALERQRSMA